MIMGITEDNILKHYTRIYSCRNNHIFIYTLTYLYPVTQHLSIFINKPFTLIRRINKSPGCTSLISANQNGICSFVAHHLIEDMRIGLTEVELVK